jgi:hypothetical protein
MSRDLRDLLAREANGVEIQQPGVARVHELVRKRGQRQRIFAAALGLSIAVVLVVGVVAVSLPTKTAGKHAAQTGGGNLELDGQFVSVASDGAMLAVMTCTSSCSEPSAARGTLTGLSAATEKVAWTTPISMPQAVAIDGQNAFTVGFGNSAVTKIDLSSGAVGSSLELQLTNPIAGDSAFLPTDIVAGDGSIWVMSERGELAQIDEETMTVTSTIQIPPKVSGGLVVLHGVAWVGDEPTGVVGFDTASGQRLSTIQISNQDEQLAVTDLTSTADRIVAVGTWATPTPNGNDLVLTNEAGAALVNPANGETVTDPVDLGTTLVGGAGGQWVSERSGGLYSVSSTGFTNEPSQQGKVVAVTTNDYWILSSDRLLSWVPRRRDV